MSLSFPPFPTLSSYDRLRAALYAASSGAGDISPDVDAVFEDMLAAELGKLDRVIPAEDVLAQLDGTHAEVPAFAAAEDAAEPVPDQGAILDKLQRIAQKYGVNANLVREVVRAESNFNPQATSRVGAKGLMQLMDATARAMHVANPYDPEQNLEGGTRYLRSLLQRYHGQVKVALAAYNAGPGRIDRLGIDSDAEYEEKSYLLPQETRSYVARISSRLTD